MGNGINGESTADVTGGVVIENCIFYDIGGYAVTAHADDDDKQYGTQIGIGDATSWQF